MLETGTRRTILNMLKTDGPSSAAALAGVLGISAMAVRQHLYALSEEGLVDAHAEADGVGRPTKQWQLTPAADDFFPQGYAELTADLMDAMRVAFGNDGLDRLVTIRTERQLADYTSETGSTSDLGERLARLAEIRTREGYMAQVESDGDGYLFTENHCPICSAARSCTGLCAAELLLFQSVLGENVEVQRTEHILQGARRCAYRVTSK